MSFDGAFESLIRLLFHFPEPRLKVKYFVMVTFAHACCVLVLSPPSHLRFHRNVTFTDIKDVIWSARDGKGTWSDVKPDLTLVMRLCRLLMLLLVEYKKPLTGQGAASTDRCVDRVGSGCVWGGGGGGASALVGISFA